MGTRWLVGLTLATVAMSGSVARGDRKSEKQAEKLMTRGIALYDDGKYEQAAVVFRRVIELVPSKGAPHFYLGRTLVALGDCAGATPELDAYLADSTRAEHVDESTALLAQCNPPVVVEHEQQPPPPAPPTAREHRNALGFTAGSLGFGHPSGLCIALSFAHAARKLESGVSVTYTPSGGDNERYTFDYLALLRVGVYRALVDGRARVLVGLAAAAGMSKGDIQNLGWFGGEPGARVLVSPSLLIGDRVLDSRLQLVLDAGVLIGTTQDHSDYHAFYTITFDGGLRVRL